MSSATRADPITEEDKQSDKYEPGVSCPHCFGTHTDDQIARFGEREKQVQLAKSVNKNVGTEARLTMEQKRQEKAEAQRLRALKAKKIRRRQLERRALHSCLLQLK